MEITVKKADLVKELSLGQGVVEKKTTIPVFPMCCWKLRTTSSVLTVTDLEIGIADVLSGGGEKDRARRRSPPGRCSITCACCPMPTSPSRSAKTTRRRSSAAARETRIAGMSRENFPELPKMPATVTKIPAELLVNAITKTIFAVANEESRYTLTGA